jgi:putative alpha-1,2-mannosidase
MPATSATGLADYGYASTFSHQNEKAQAGYYSVFLNNPQVAAELTTTQRVGLHRYSFAPNSAEWLVVNLKHRDEVLDSKLEVVNRYTLRGYRFSKAWARNQKVLLKQKAALSQELFPRFNLKTTGHHCW